MLCQQGGDIGWWLVSLVPLGERLSVHTSGESCIVRGSCISGEFLSFFLLFAGCVEPCLFLEGPALHMLGCVEPLPLS